MTSPIRKSHSDLAELDRLMPFIREFQVLADRHGISDVFQDNGGKALQLLLIMGLKVLPGREGNDAIDEMGVEYEMKTLNINNKGKGFTTHHHLNPVIIEKYRKVPWVFGIYSAIELKSIYLMDAGQLEPLFKEWEAKWRADGNKDINNPKIPLSFVIEYGALVYGTAPVLTTRKRKAAVAPAEKVLLKEVEEALREEEEE
jgi:hypothetical protein